MISGEIYDMSEQHKAIIMYESSLQKKEKALDVAFKEIQAPENVKNAIQSYRDSLRNREKSLMDAIAAMNAGADLFTWSNIKETLKNKVAEREYEIKELRLKLMENRES